MLNYLEKEIKDGITVADLGCGTFIHTKHMGMAARVYAVDINREMLDYGMPKIETIKEKVTVLCESGTKTSIPSDSCNLVWIDGLSEFINLSDLFIEVRRILKKDGKFIILYPNLLHPENIIVVAYYWFLNRDGKKYRTIYEFKKTGIANGFGLIDFQSTAVFIYLPGFIQKYLLGLWGFMTKLYQPFQKKFPIGNNIICTFVKR
ncbi:MAG: class I SAM-dependent methyltransferase [bacterium]|nr:class I SAM-dependent methyltransferase [bacterium]